jgi:hypothetical protein
MVYINCIGTRCHSFIHFTFHEEHKPRCAETGGFTGNMIVGSDLTAGPECRSQGVAAMSAARIAGNYGMPGRAAA